MKLEELKGKKVLMIHNGGERHGSLYKHVCTELGMAFCHIADKPNEHAFGKIAGRLHLSFYEEILYRYYKKAIETYRDEFDYIIVIRGEYTPQKAVQLLREKNPNAKLILYMWDSIKNNRGIEKKWHLFDKVYTFDRMDYLAHQGTIGFIPLFYCEEYIDAMSSDQEENYDIAFIGTAHGDRAKIVNQVEAECKAQGLKMFKFLYSPHILVYYYNKMFNKDYRHVNRHDLSFSLMTQKQIYSVYNQTKCILDVEIKTQTGLTMRTMDILGLKKKLITTNQDIINYDFYNENNISVIDRTNVQIDYDFIQKPYEDIDESIYKKYSMRNWLIQLFS